MKTDFLNNGLVVLIALIVLVILFRRRVRTSSAWHATVTPLASIIGSGFLICGPLLALVASVWAPLVMLGIVLLAYGLGASIRHNILQVEGQVHSGQAPISILVVEDLSRLFLGIAYIISVAFYLKLLSIFALRGLGFQSHTLENIVTTAIMVLIAVSGKIKGLSLLEIQEMYAVNFKLSIIFALIVVLFFYNAEHLLQGKALLMPDPSNESFMQAFRKILGTLLIIQGFETSRYLGSKYSPELRVRTMRYAQIISAIIYVAFIALSITLLHGIHTITETLIIRLTIKVALILPILITIAGIMSQFSAAIADTIGSAGLFEEETRGMLSRRNSYLLIGFFVIVLVWLANIYSIITIASKAFAIYYALQLINSLITMKKEIKKNVLSITLFTVLLIIMILVIAIGIPVE